MKTTLVSLMLMSVFILSAMAVDGEFGIYYGMSVIPPYGDNGGAIVTAQIPSGAIDTGEGTNTFYTMYFFGKHFATGFELNSGIFSVFDNSSENAIFSIGSTTFAAQTVYYLLDHYLNSPYLLGRISQTRLMGSNFSFYDDDFDITSLGIGVGYQHYIGPGFVLRTELRYHRMFATPERDFSNVFSGVIGFGIK